MSIKKVRFAIDDDQDIKSNIIDVKIRTKTNIKKKSYDDGCYSLTGSFIKYEKNNSTDDDFLPLTTSEILDKNHYKKIMSMLKK